MFFLHVFVVIFLNILVSAFLISKLVNVTRLVLRLIPEMLVEMISLKAEKVGLGVIHKLRLQDEVGRWSKNVHFVSTFIPENLNAVG